MCYFEATQGKDCLSNEKENMKTALCIIGLFLISSCAKDDNNCMPSSQSYTFQANKSIDTSAHEVSVVSGSSIVFKFQHNYEQCEGVVGARVSREVYFEVPAMQSNFQYTNESLLPANVFVYLKAPIDPSLRTTRVVLGSVHGTQINASKWHITASLISGGETINFDEDFIRID